jgi:amino acid transporter
MRMPRWIVGKPKDVGEPGVFQHISLIAFFAWVGLGADGLSSSAYGPEEAFRHLEAHAYLAVFLAGAMALTVFVLCAAYSRIIELFPAGGGGYVVTSRLLGERAGVVSGSALLVDYVLTISISSAAGVNSIFPFLPDSMQQFRLPAKSVAIVLLMLLNLRGVKESIFVLTPIFLVFLVTHVILIGGIIAGHLPEVGTLAHGIGGSLSSDLSTIGLGGIGLIFARAYALGGGTYTGIEAVSNGIPLMREPRVQTGKRTMLLMGSSLAATAGGLLLCYLLLGIQQIPGEPMNATLAKAFAGSWRVAGLDIGHGFVLLTLFSEGALLFVAAQSGFVAGPGVMATMATDSWLPRQLAALSEQLTIRNGIYMMGGAAIAVLLYTGGDVHQLVVMYSINVFLTFTLANLAMTRYWVMRRGNERWISSLAIHGFATVLCATILIITAIEKFTAGGWVTLVVTGAVIALAYAVKAHYKEMGRKIAKLNQDLAALASEGIKKSGQGGLELDPEKPTAVVLVGSYSGLGIHTMLQIERVFPGQFRQVMFISAGVVDSGAFKGADQVGALRAKTERDLANYVEFARKKLGWAADFDAAVGTDAVFELERLCRQIYLRFPRSVFFAGQLVVQQSTWWYRLLHNETAFSVQRRLQYDRLPMVILPTRVL